jgi:predicted tellurium resistance membrane protein TerC
VTELFTLENVIALVTLASLEIVLGIDNIIFVAILAAKLPPHQQNRGRQIGLGLAMVLRILLLCLIGWIMGLTRELFAVPAFWTSDPSDRFAVSGRDLILFTGGLFLIGKATYEIHDKLEGPEGDAGAARVHASFGTVIAQIVMIDVVFSLDAVITAVGMVKTRPEAPWVGLTIMITAVVIAVGIMLVSAARVSAFIERHPTLKMLALAFLILIGVMLVVEGLHSHIPKGYIYFSMAFALGVELLNMRLRKVGSPVHLHQGYVAPGPGQPAAGPPAGGGTKTA